MKKTIFSKFFDFLGFAIAYFQKIVYNDFTFLDKKKRRCEQLERNEKTQCIVPCGYRTVERFDLDTPKRHTENSF